MLFNGHGFYKTLFQPTVKFILKDNLQQEITLQQQGELVEIENDIRLSVQTPNIQEIETQYNIKYPCKINVSIAIDSKFYSDSFDIFLIIQNPTHNTIFNIF